MDLTEICSRVERCANCPLFDERIDHVIVKDLGKESQVAIPMIDDDNRRDWDDSVGKIQDATVALRAAKTVIRGSCFFSDSNGSQRKLRDGSGWRD